MALKSAVFVGLGLCLVAAGVVWTFGSKLRPAAPKPPATEPVAVLSSPKPNADGVGVERDRVMVFQRAFWRRPAPADRILHAERRQWQTSGGAVEKWQWFIAVEPSAAFRDWLLKENPFQLVPVPAGTPL